jgi:hypothetical protein
VIGAGGLARRARSEHACDINSRLAHVPNYAKRPGELQRRRSMPMVSYFLPMAMFSVLVLRCSVVPLVDFPRADLFSSNSLCFRIIDILGLLS